MTTEVKPDSPASEQLKISKNLETVSVVFKLMIIKKGVMKVNAAQGMKYKKLYTT
jgi:hypothetical protein